MDNMPESTHYDVAAHSDVGGRERNEDAFLIDHELGLFVVADGLGGHPCGDTASALTCDIIRREVAAGGALQNSLHTANREVAAQGESRPGCAGMASTVVAVRLLGQRYEVAWVGDSRAYLWHGELSPLTEDHSQVQAQLAAGKITAAEARSHPGRHIVLQAIGLHANETLSVGNTRGALRPGQILLLCSDGLSDPLDEAQLALPLAGTGSVRQICERLVKSALQQGGLDNCTALIIRCSEKQGASIENDPGHGVQTNGVAAPGAEARAGAIAAAAAVNPSPEHAMEPQQTGSVETANVADPTPPPHSRPEPGGANIATRLAIIGFGGTLALIILWWLLR